MSTFNPNFTATDSRYLTAVTANSTFGSTVILRATNDGSAAVHNAINSAAALAVASNVPLMIPAGTYLIASGITFPVGLRVTGYGAKIIGSRPSSYVIQVSANVSIEGLSIQNSDTSTSNLGIDITTNAVNVLIKNCSFYGTVGATQAINVNSSGIRNLDIIGCKFDKVAWGILTNSGANDIKNVRVEKCSFTNIYADAIEFNHPTASQSPNANGFVVSQNIIEVPVGLGSGLSAGFGIGVAGCTDVVISHNVIRAFRHEAIHIENFSRRVTIVGNICTNSTGSDATAAIAFYGGCYEVSVAGNTIENVTGHGIYGVYDGNPIGNTDISITGNTIKSATGNGMQLGSNPGNAYTVSGNIISGSGGNGISIAGELVALSITGNMIYLNSGYGITNDIYPRLRVVDNNIIYGNTLGDVQGQGITNGNALLQKNKIITAYGNAASNSSGIAAVPLMRAGRSSVGRLSVQARVIGNWSTRFDAIWEVSWDGTVLSAKRISQAVNGNVDNFSLSVVNNMFTANVLIGTVGSPSANTTLDLTSSYSGFAFEDGSTNSGTVVGSLPSSPRIITANTQAGASYTLAVADVTRAVEMTSAASNSVIIPPNSSVNFDIGVTIDVVQFGTGTTTLVAGAGVTLRAPLGLRIQGQYGTATLRKHAADEWIVSGYIGA